jgi:hypothetical protein
VDVGWSRNGRYFRVRLCDEICTREDFPFGMLLLQHVSRDGRVLAARLTPIQHQTGGIDAGHWVAIEERSAWLGTSNSSAPDPDMSEVVVWIVTPEHPEVLAAISDTELTRYQNDRFVRNTPHLLAGARQLEAVKRESLAQ